jgi:hypothetical protein
MSAEATILTIAAAQLGIVTFEQLLAAGLSRNQIQRRLAAGSLVSLYRGVYTTTLTLPTIEQRALAACLATRVRAFASHSTALVLLGIADVPTSKIDVTVPSDVRIRIPGVNAHRSGVLGPRESSARGPLVVSRPARALIDSAGLFGELEIESFVDSAIRGRMLTPRSLLIEASRQGFANRPGLGVLRRLATQRSGEGSSESELEDRAVRLLRRFGLPRPVRQYMVTLSGRVLRFDLAYPDQRLAIELNGWGPHFGREPWQRDHDRRNASEVGHWRMLEFTWSDVNDRPWFVVSTVADALGIRPRRWSIPPGL